MKKDFLENIKQLIEMYYYTDSQNLRFLAWIKARPDNFSTFEALKLEERIKMEGME